MKLNIKLSTIALAAVALFSGSCTTMDSVHEEYFELSNETYIGKPELTSITPGYLRSQMTWTKTSDPRVTMTRVFWDTGADDGCDTIYIDYLNGGVDADFVVQSYDTITGDTVLTMNIGLSATEVAEFKDYQTELDDGDSTNLALYEALLEKGMPEGEYTVYIENLGDEDTKSLYTTYPVSVYGPSRVSTLTARSVSSTYVMDDGTIYIKWGSAEDCDGVTLEYQEDVTTDEWFVYHNEEDPDGGFAAVDTLVLTTAQQDSEYKYYTHYRPEQGLDRITTKSYVSRSFPFMTYELTKYDESAGVWRFAAAIETPDNTYYLNPDENDLLGSSYVTAYGEVGIDIGDNSNAYRYTLWDENFSSYYKTSEEFVSAQYTSPTTGTVFSTADRRTITIDLGAEYRLTEFRFHQTCATSAYSYARMFAQGNLRSFNLYGIGDVAAKSSAYTNGVDGGFTSANNNTTLIHEEYLRVQEVDYYGESVDGEPDYVRYIIPDFSASDEYLASLQTAYGSDEWWGALLYGSAATILSGSSTPTDADYAYAAENGHSFDLTNYRNPVRFIRIQLLENWSGTADLFEMSEIRLYGAAVNDDGDILPNPFE